MINQINGKYIVDNTNVEVFPISIVNGKETLNYQTKPDFYKINLIDFKNLHFDSINKVKAFLKQDSTIQTLLNSIDNEEDRFGNLNSKINETSEIIVEASTDFDYIRLLAALPEGKKDKILKWIGKL